MESQFWGSPKALEGERQRGGQGRGCSYLTPVGSLVCAQHLRDITDPHCTLLSWCCHLHFTHKEVEAYRIARIVKSISESMS